MKNRIWLYLLFLCPIFVSAQQNSYVSPAGTQYLLYTPPSYATGTQSHPLLISLHGKGEMGSDINILTVNNPHQNPSKLIYLNKWSKDLPFIVLSPLFTPPADDPMPQWPAEYIDEVVRQVTANYRVDMNRIYVTGLSLGGTGTWTYAAAFPQKVAAVLPISGRSDLTKACVLKNIPAWVFHGDGDPTVTMQYSIDMINAINNCKVSALYRRRLSVMHTRAHNGWSEIYNGSNGNRIYDWLLKFTKGNTTNTSPYVNAGADRTILMRSSSYHIYGDYFDADGSISSVLWTQISGPALTLANINSEFFRVSGLQPGTYEFQLAVTDNSGATGTDRVVLKILDASTLPVVNSLVLMNGLTNTDIRTLTEGLTINKAQLGTSQVNIRAEASANTGSVRFSINADQHTRTINSPGPYCVKTQSSSPEWDVKPGHYVICATAYPNTGGGGTPGPTYCVKIKVTDDPAIVGCENSGKVYREVWPGVPGTAISNIPVLTRPTAKTDLNIFESPTDVWDNFGERIRGYVCAPVTGAYRFWVSGNDNCELWLSTDENPINKTRIAYVTGFTNVRQWTKYPSQTSAFINLEAGRKYYVEALHKEGIESDHFAAGWQLPDGTLERPIPGVRLIPFGTAAIAGESNTVIETEILADDAISVYPNPIERTETMLHVKGLQMFRDYHKAIEVRSITGASIVTDKVECDCDEHIMNLPTNLSPGVYIINIYSDGKRATKRVFVR